MSVKLSAYVWDGCAAAGLKISAVAIMARLADFSSDEGLCWPSITTIARQLGAGESTVRTTLGKLEADGWITSTQRRKGNRNTSNMYQLNIAKLRTAAQPSDSDASKSDTSNSDRSKSDASKSVTAPGFHPPESEGDPLVNSKQDPSDNKPFCQPAAQPDAEVEITDQAKQVLNYLNLKTGSRYQVSKSSLDNIRARLRDGFTVEEQQLTVDYMHAKWGGDLDMAEYLRPSTLFQPSKFPGYLEGANAWKRAGCPARKNGKWDRGDGAVDTTERDSAYRRFTSGVAATKTRSDLEKLVCKEASKANVRGMRSDFAVTTWNRIWNECHQRQGKGDKAA
ncbi:MAG: conserved phage C-terminal domain-containing protein [Rouxiella aceris]|uniref:conserved phage C-terminal domain-containing protein n=1 Tax=Rouxiella aceris TaxID=2703884 RepID=UPI002842B9D6|nr:conserved phage C-terminal domain-containing protein [Rouxiella aceris]MDR3431073.1 conserved phage C-terminal domain-containing protein [Rouxiella aceris]